MAWVVLMKWIFDGMSRAQIITVIAIATALTLSRMETLPPFHFGDGVAFIILGAMLWWFLSPSRDKTAAHDHGDQSVFFRLGKALNGIVRRKGV